MTINELIMKIEEVALFHEKEASFYKNMLSVLYKLTAEEVAYIKDKQIDKEIDWI